MDKDILLKDWLNQPPPPEYVKPVPDREPALHIPIEFCEMLMDEGTGNAWSTINFRQAIYQDENGDLCAYGSIELFLPVNKEKEWEDGRKSLSYTSRTLTGCANVNLPELKKREIPDWSATLKSMCIKNALSDWGTKTGRGLNAFLNPDLKNTHPPVIPKKDAPPDVRKIHSQYAANGDIEKCKKLEAIYNF